MAQQQSGFPYLAVGISILLGCLFLVLFFLAVTHQPDYMPSRQKQNAAHVQPSGAINKQAET
ncbi:cbb3-type cytochrome oxidase assembly protein [Acinetobacter sp. A47]|uniref:cbb3-type cytochrome oxidase assembly protein n=1 Tax=Acinetobacter sp. A47 TaxID=1561217 RepID=UPI000570D51C|nr:cbb3-type cytochrome oxidase assembly protein [Acinetobacter sp. A47]